MTDRPNLDSRLATYLASEAPTAPPERLIHATRDRIADTPQRGGVGGARWLSPQRAPWWTATVAGVLAVGIAIVLVLPTRPNSTGGEPPPSPSPTACPSGQECLHELQPGAHVSIAFKPTVRYTVPAGWTNSLDVLGQFDLRWSAGGRYTYPDGLTFRDGVSIFRRPVAESSTSPLPEEGVGTTSNDLVEWLARRVGLTASSPSPATVGEAHGYRVVLSVPHGPRVSPDHCTTDHGEDRCVSLFVSDDPAATYGFGLVGPEIAVVYLLDLPRGETVMVVIDDVDGVDQAGLEAAAATIVSSLEFSP